MSAGMSEPRGEKPERSAQAGTPLTREVRDPSAVSARPARTRESEPWNDSWGLAGLLKQLQTAIRDAPPEAWDEKTRQAARTAVGSLSNRLGELEGLDRLAFAVPCLNQRCELQVIALWYGRPIRPDNVKDRQWLHINARGELLRPQAEVDGEAHIAAPRKPKGQGR